MRPTNILLVDATIAVVDIRLIKILLVDATKLLVSFMRPTKILLVSRESLIFVNMFAPPTIQEVALILPLNTNSPVELRTILSVEAPPIFDIILKSPPELPML